MSAAQCGGTRTGILIIAIGTRLQRFHSGNLVIFANPDHNFTESKRDRRSMQKKTSFVYLWSVIEQTKVITLKHAIKWTQWASPRAVRLGQICSRAK